MPTKERYSNPTCGDTVNLRLFTYNMNARRNVAAVEKIDVYFLDPTLVSESNPDGRRLVQTIDGDNVSQEETGQYLAAVLLEDPKYTIGQYLDVWTVQFEDSATGTGTVANPFAVYPDLWFTTPIPPVYDFSFQFRPNKIVKGTKRYLIIQVTPNVPRGADLIQYYENLAAVSEIRMSMEIKCGECVPAERDLRRVIDRQVVDHREKNYAYFYLDTTELDLGIYDVWFELTYGENVYISEKNQLQIFD